MGFEAKALEEPRIAIWIGGNWDKVKPQERAAKYDGYFPLKWGGQVSVEEWGDIKTKLFKHRSSDAPFDLIHGGSVPKDDPDAARKMIQDYEQVGITWW